MQFQWYSHDKHYEMLTDWLVRGHKWNSGIPKGHLGSVGLVAYDEKDRPLAMGFLAVVEEGPIGCNFAFLTHMVGNPAVGASLKRGAIREIMELFVLNYKSVTGPSGGMVAVYSNRLIVNIAKEVGFTEASGEGAQDYFLYLPFGKTEAEQPDYLND